MPDAGGLSAGGAYQSGQSLPGAEGLWQAARDYALAQPKSTLNQDKAINDTFDLLKPGAGETPEQWFQRFSAEMKNTGTISDPRVVTLKNNVLQYGKKLLGSYKTAGTSQTSAADAKAAAAADSWQARINAFYQAMMVPVEQDPHAQQILRSAASAGSTVAYGRGIEGPGQALAATQAAQNAAYQEQARRQGLGLQALQLGSGNQLGLQGLQLQAQQLQYQNDLNQRMYQGAQANKGSQQFAGALQGGLSGAMAGASFGPYGALAGGALGAGLGYFGAGAQQPVAPPNMQFGGPGLRNA